LHHRGVVDTFEEGCALAGLAVTTTAAARLILMDNLRYRSVRNPQSAIRNVGHHRIG
jgi:hypothetical protein